MTVAAGGAGARVVLFAVGSGGDPRRHEPLIAALAAGGAMVVAPHFARLATPRPTEDELTLRARRSTRALAALAQPQAALAGVGHSIGGTMLLALAGAQLWMGPGRPLAVTPLARLDRIALMAPPTGFFQAPGALDAVSASVQLWTGTDDALTPPSQAELVRAALVPRVAVDLRLVAGASHFSFMHMPPPHAVETLPDRDDFLATLTRELTAFVMR